MNGYEPCYDYKTRWCISGPDTCDGGTWTSSGEEDPFGSFEYYGHYGCCQDDSGEFYDPDRCETTPEDVDACCNSAEDIVDPTGRCRNTQEEGLTEGEICNYCSDELCGSDGDSDPGACASCSGQWGLTDGDSPGLCWEEECCGDDGLEYPIQCGLNTDSPDLTCGSDFACCDSGDDCLNPFNDECVSGNPREPAQVKSGGEDMYALCTFTYSGGSWMDCDAYGQTGCPGAVGYCGSDVCGSNGGVPKGSNADVGDYSEWSGETKYQCCGDDFGEKYVDTMRDDTSVSDQGIMREDCPDITVQGFCCEAVHNSVVYDPDTGEYLCSADAPDPKFSPDTITNCDGCMTMDGDETACGTYPECWWDGEQSKCLLDDYWWDSNYGKCCQDGTHWDGAQCVANPTECYDYGTGDPLMCTYMPPNDPNNPEDGWWASNYCFKEHLMDPCCWAKPYNEWGYYRSVETIVWD